MSACNGPNCTSVADRTWESCWLKSEICCTSHSSKLRVGGSFFAKCKTFNVLYIGGGKYLSSTVNPIVAKQMYMTSELHHWATKGHLSLSSIIFTQLKSEFTQLHLLKFLCKCDHFSKILRKTKLGVFLLKHSVYILCHGHWCDCTGKCLPRKVISHTGL